MAVGTYIIIPYHKKENWHIVNTIANAHNIPTWITRSFLVKDKL